MDEAKDYIPIEAFFGEGIEPNHSIPGFDPRGTIESADIVLGVDVMSEWEFLVFGRETLQRIAKGDESLDPHIVRVGVDQETDELEKLVALVLSVKGYEDYSSVSE